MTSQADDVAYDPTTQPYDEPFKNGRTPEGCCNPEVDVMIYCDCAKCQGREEWMRALREDVIEGEYGYEPGEFAVYPHLWVALYNEGLTPSQAFKRALDAHRERRAR